MLRQGLIQLALSGAPRAPVPAPPTPSRSPHLAPQTGEGELGNRGADVSVVDRPLARVMAHRMVLGQILANLAANAAKFVRPARDGSSGWSWSAPGP